MIGLNDFVEKEKNILIDPDRIAPMVAIRSVLANYNLSEMDKLKINEEILFMKQLAEMESKIQIDKLTKGGTYLFNQNKILKRRLWIVLSLEVITIISFLITVL